MTVAAAIAPEVDRLVIAVHFGVRDRYRDDLAPRLHDAGLESLQFINDLAEWALAGALTSGVVRWRFRYAAAAARLHIQQLIDQGALREVGSRIEPSEASAAVLRAALDARAETARRLWGNHGAEVKRVTSLTERVLQAGVDISPLARSFRTLPAPTDPYHRLHHELTALRYVRADAHGDAWRERLLTADEIVPLTTLWLDRPPPADGLERLAERGFATPAPWRLTVAGKRLRNAIEDDTNRRIEPAFDVLGEEERGELERLLRGLPGDLPS